MTESLLMFTATREKSDPETIVPHKKVLRSYYENGVFHETQVVTFWDGDIRRYDSKPLFWPITRHKSTISRLERDKWKVKRVKRES